MLKKYKCYVCWNFTHAERLPDDFEGFEGEYVHKTCAENLRKFEEHTKPWREKIEREIYGKLEK